METKILNYCNHEITIYDRDGKNIICRIPSKGEARCVRRVERIGTFCNLIPIVKSNFREVIGLPAQQLNTYYIVSRYVFIACVDRKDLLMPDDLVRVDGSENVIGCRSLAAC